MERNNIPKGREKKTGAGSAGVGRKGSGLGTGPVGNAGGFNGRPTGGLQGLSQGLNNAMPPSLRGKNGGMGCGCLGVIVFLVIIVFVLSTLFRGCMRGSSGGFSLFDLLFGGSGGYESSYNGNYGGSQSADDQWNMPEIQTEAPAQAPAQNQGYVPSVAGGNSQSPQSSQSSHYNGSPQLSATSNNNGVLNETVAAGARDKYTEYTGTDEDTATVMIYMCGSDLESRSGMGTSDLQEMLKSGIGDNVNLLVYTGGAKKWQNNIINASTNQLYRIRTEGGQTGLECLIKDDGNKAMSDPATLTAFIKYCTKNFPSNRNILILWDHGAGTVNGYAYDEKHAQNGYMSLAGIKEALKAAKTKFDFIGFDACLMATVETGLMLNDFADYLIASEETEPGTGWYYTDWLKLLTSDPDISTPRLGKQIADDFTDASQKYARGADTTLAVIDLAELKSTVPLLFRNFAVRTKEQIDNDDYKAVATARGNTKEFAASNKIDQIDLVNFAQNLGTDEGIELAAAIQNAVKYNRTSRGYEKAYGLSIFFPYRSQRSVDTAARLYDQIGFADEYASCIRAFANLEVTGQVSAGGAGSSYGSLFGSLLGGDAYDMSSLFGGYGQSASQGYSQSSSQSQSQGGYTGGYGSYSDYYGQGYGSSGTMDTEMIESLLGMFLGGRGSVAGLSEENTKFIDGDLMKADAAYVAANSINVNNLSWVSQGSGKVLAFTDSDWEAVDHILLNCFVDDGEGFIDLGLDNLYEFDDNGNLKGDYDGTWLSVNGNIVSYCFLDEEDGEDGSYLIRGYIPALINGQRSEIYVSFDDENPYGYVTGYRYKYMAGEDGEGQEAKLLSLAEGDEIEFIADYYDYNLNYLDSYRISDPLTYDGSFELENIRVDGNVSAAYRITDIYNQHYWTPQM